MSEETKIQTPQGSGPAVPFVVRLPADLHRWLASEALRQQCSMNWLVVGAVRVAQSGRDQ